MFGLTTLLVREVSITGHRQRRSQNKAEEAMPPPKSLLRFIAGVLYQSQLFENKRKEQSDSCRVLSLTKV